MKFRNYCLIVIGSSDGMLDAVTSVSDNKPNTIDGVGLFIATFSSSIDPIGLTAFFNSMKKNFFIFDLEADTTGFNMVKEHIHAGLFGFLKNPKLEKERNEMLNTLLSSQIILLKNSDVSSDKISLDDIDNMNKLEKEQLMDKLLEDPKNLSEHDKKILEKIAKISLDD